ncbi:uncharacterized protein LOC144652325 [Oculina patagonica]
MCQYLYMAIEKEKRTTKKARVATLLQVAELQSQGITVDGMHYTVTWPSEENEFVRWDVLAARLAHSPQSETLGVLEVYDWIRGKEDLPLFFTIHIEGRVVLSLYFLLFILREESYY